MATFSISAMAAQCGVTTANIRSWERYGLLQPTKDEAGNRFYCIEDAIRIQHIIDALSKGFSLKEIKPALYGEETHCRSGWLFYQEEILAQCRKFEPAKLRKLLWRYGREIPPCIVIESILRPLRLWLSAGDDDARRFEKALLDTAIIEYATFQLSSVRKAPAGTMLIATPLSYGWKRLNIVVKVCELKSSPGRRRCPIFYQRLSSILFCGMMRH